MLQDLPGYSELFGPQNYCKCPHCQSIFGPAAYFVDLMRFIDKKISRRNFINPNLSNHPAYLRNRRADLWSLQLTCENTDTPVRYIEIVNEVLERYLDSTDPLDGDIWENLATEARSSFKQPFNLPHAEMLLSLQYLGVGLNEISALFNENRNAATYTRLGISLQELATLSTAAPIAVRQRFAKPFTDDLSEHDTHLLTQLAGITREMLERLVKSDFVRGNVAVEFNLSSESDDLTGFLEHLVLRVTDNADTEASLRAFLDRLHRLIRLQRALGWTPEALQMAIDALNTSPPIAPDSDPARYGEALSRELLTTLTDLKQLMDKFDLSVSEALAICDHIPVGVPDQGATSLWVQLFGDLSQLMVRHPTLGNNQPGETEVSQGFGYLQGVLQVTEPDLINLLQRDLPALVIDGGLFEQEHLNRLYRSARIAQVLDLSQDAFAALTSIVPDLTANVAAPARLTAIHEAINVVDSLDRSGLTFDKLFEFLDGSQTADHDIARAAELLDQLHDKIRDIELLWMTPTSLSQIEGMTAESARAAIQHMLGAQNLLLQPDETRERYLVNDGIALVENDPRLLEALSLEGGPLHGSDDDHAAAFLAQALRHQVLQHLASKHAASALAEALKLSEDTRATFDRFFANPNPLKDENIGLAAWLGAENGSPSIVLLAYVTALIRLKSLLIDTLDASDDAIQFIADRTESFEIAPLLLTDPAPPAEGWRWATLWRFSALAHVTSGSEVDPATRFRLLDGWSDGGFAASTLPDLALMFDVTLGQIKMLLAELPADEDVFSALHRIEEAVRLTSRTGLDPVSLRQLTAETFVETMVAKDLILGAIRTKQPTEQAWSSVSDFFAEELETLKRNALVDRILSRRELHFKNTRDIYHFFLLDPEMDSCFQTSRVKNAISTCQLYVQRCLMGLETSNATDAHAAIQVKVKEGKKSREEWKWRKSYRVWEANRKVFLYPENYMLPDLRDDRSHIFKTAESDLLQGNLDNDTVKQVFQRYLAEFVEVGNIQIVHTLYEKATYHFFGRTLQEPYRYFMRRFNGKGHWEPWEPIDLDIGAKTISAVMKNGELHLFWTNVEMASDADKIKGAQPDFDPDDVVDDEGQQIEGKSQESLPITISYATQNEAGKWSQPQDFIYYSLLLSKNGQEKNWLLPISDRIYAEGAHPSGSIDNSNSGVHDLIRLIHPVTQPYQAGDAGVDLKQYLGFLNKSDSITIQRNGKETRPLGNKGSFDSWSMFKTPGLHLGESALWRIKERNSSSTASVDYLINGRFKDYRAKNSQGGPGSNENSAVHKALEFDGVNRSGLALKAVQRSTQESVLNAGDKQYLLKLTGQPGFDRRNPIDDDVNSVFWFSLRAASLAKWRLVNLTTTYPARLSKVFFENGLAKMLSPSQQNKPEPTASQSGLSFPWLGMIRMPDEDYGFSNLENFASGDLPLAVSQFDGVHGNYLWELHFHLPFLVAHTLNSIGKFEEADRWYRFIFDPTTRNLATNSHWRFTVFRTLKQPKLLAILSDRAAIRKYKNDPFNPFAIARLRPTAFQKAIVMRYIDNLLDWGDARFQNDTRESNSEAMLLYIMAADLLGERPIETGECDLADSFSYEDIESRGSAGDFLVELENLVYFYVNMGTIIPVNKVDPNQGFASVTSPDSGSAPPAEPVVTGDQFVTRSGVAARFQPYASVRERVASRLTLAQSEDDGDAISPGATDIAFQPNLSPEPDPPFEPTYDFVAKDGDDPYLDGPVLDSRRFGFCVPPNDTLLAYWDRVEDRLYKLRHCMNIDGVVRELPLWQPPIDPMLLVRAKAAGLELDDVVALGNQQPPQHRFEILLERARRFTATAQQFGGQLLSALERKDESELTLLRSVHEDTILNLVRRQKQDAIADTKNAHEHLKRSEATIQARLNHYASLIGQAETGTPGGTGDYGLIKEEHEALNEMALSKERQEAAGKAESKAQRYREIGPQWTVGTQMELGAKTGSERKRSSLGLPHYASSIRNWIGFMGLGKCRGPIPTSGIRAP